jgi:hypothetical protein
MSLQALLSFLKLPPAEDDQQRGSRSLIQLIVDTTENLNLLQNLADVMFFKTEVKKKPGVPDDVAGMQLEEKARQLSCKVLLLISAEILTVRVSPNFCELFQTVPSIMHSCCEVNLLDKIPSPR